MNLLGTMLSTAIDTATAAGKKIAEASAAKNAAAGTAASSASSSAQAAKTAPSGTGAVTQTWYVDPSGAYKTGYIRNGVTYADSGLSSTVPVGSVVNTQAGQYLKTADGSVKYSGGNAQTPTQEQVLLSNLQSQTGSDFTPTPAYDYINQWHDSALASQEEKLKSAYETNTSNLDAEQAKLGPQYYASRQQEAANNALEKQRFNETAAAYGLNSGTSGQAQLSFSNDLQKGLSDLQAAEAAANTEIERQRTNLAKEYQSSILQAQADNDSDRMQQLYQEAARIDQALQSQSQYNATKALQTYSALLDQYNTDRSYNYGVSQDRQSAALDAAKIQAQLGDYSALGKIYGWSDAQIKAYNALANVQSASASKSSSSGSSGTKSSGSSGSSGGSSGSGSGGVEALFEAAYASGAPYTYIKQKGNYKKYGLTSAPSTTDYKSWLESSGKNVSYGTMSSVARQLADRMNQYGMDKTALAENVEKYLADGRITEGEASYLLSMAGL